MSPQYDDDYDEDKTVESGSTEGWLSPVALTCDLPFSPSIREGHLCYVIDENRYYVFRNGGWEHGETRVAPPT